MNIKSLDDVCTSTKKIYVVGNGPLNDEDRDKISTASCVLRFNDMRNMRENESTDIVAMRNTFLHLLERDDRYKNIAVLPVIERDEHFIGMNHSTLLPIFVSETQHDKRKFTDDFLFPHCSAKKQHTEAPWGPSTGAAVLNYLENMTSVEEIEVFGMNFNGPKEHVDFKHNTLVKECCTKCNFNETKTKKYT